MMKFDGPAMDIPQADILNPGQSGRLDRVQKSMLLSIKKAEAHLCGERYGFDSSAAMALDGVTGVAGQKNNYPER